MRNIIFSAAMITASFVTAPAHAFKFPEAGRIPIPENRPAGGMPAATGETCVIICGQQGAGDCLAPAAKCESDPAGSMPQQ